MRSLEKFENYVLNAFLIILPLFILPAFPNIYATPKVIFLATVVLTILGIKIIKINTFN